MEGLLKRVNDGVYAVERGIVVITSVLMAIVVFFDVVHRRYSSAESKLVEKLGKWTGIGRPGSLKCRNQSFRLLVRHRFRS